MNRYKITNKQNGMQFEIEADAWPPAIGLQPAWGTDPEVVTENIDAEIAAGVQKKIDAIARRERLQNHKNDILGMTSVPQIRVVIKDILDELNGG